MAEEDRTASATTTPTSPPGPVPSANDELAKALLADRYQIQRRIGAGGMGVVYAGRDVQLDRAVAIKLVSRPADSEAAQARLVREARAMAKLRHPNVATVYDIGTAGHRIFIVMELVDGGTLADWLKAEPRTWRQVVSVFLQAARGLAAAHAEGIVHRDFKPENVLFGKDGVVRVTDFGLVRLVGDVERGAGEPTGTVARLPTGSGTIVGTPGYIAPEILHSERVDARADVFSFCVALYAALYGRRPFPPLTGSSRVSETLGALRPAPPRVGPRWLQRIVLRGLRAQPADRWPSIGALAAAIERRLGRRRRALTLAAVGALAVASAAAVIVARRASPERPKRISDLQQHQITFDGNATSFGLSPDGRTLAYLSQNRLRFVDLERRREEEMATSLAVKSYVRQYHRWLPDSSALETLVVLNPSMTNLNDFRGLRIPRAGEPVFVPRVFDGGYSPDGMEVATAKMAAKQIDILRGDALVRTLPVAGVYDVLHTYEWSPDGRWLLIGTAKGQTLTAWTLSVDGAEKVHLFEKEEVEGQPLHFAPRGDGILYLRSHSREENDLVFLPLMNGRPAGESHAVIEGIQASEFTLNRDGIKLAYTRTRELSKLWLFTIAEPDSPDPDVHARRLLANASFKQSTAISPDGKRIAYTARDSQWQDLFIVPIDGGLPLRVTPSDGIKCSADWSPDGNEIAYIVQDPGGKLSMWIVSLADGRTRQLSPTPSYCNLRWVSQATIAFPSSGNRNVTLIDPRSGAERPLLMDEGRGWAFNPVWSLDGAWVAVAWNREQTGAVKDAFKGMWVVSADGRIERPLLRGSYWPLGWSSDGQWIYAAVARPDDLRQFSSKTIFRIPFSGGDAQPWLTLPIDDENVAECNMSADARQMACIAGAESDVWVIDDFDRLLPN